MTATSYAYISRNVSLDELAEFGCDVFSDSKSRNKTNLANFEDDYDGIAGFLDDQDVDYIRHFN